MLNVDQITSELARLPDQSLQRYAMMHKDDPYVLSLALSESNRRKQLRAGAQMQAPQQPRVADQALAGMTPAPQAQPMLPEHVGIGALPAPNMQRFDGGGIVSGLDDPTNDGQLAYNNEPVLRMADGGMVAFADNPDQPVSSDMPATSDEDQPLWARVLRSTKQAKTTAAQQAMEAERAKNMALVNAGAASGYAGRGIAQLADPTVGAIGATPVAETVGIPIAAPGGARPPAVRPPVAAPGIAAVAPGAAAAPAMDPVQQAMALRKAIYGEEPPMETREQLLAAQQKYAGESPYAAQLQRIQDQAKQAAADKDEARGIALLKAGLGMMAARSPYAMVGIGEGAKAGVEDYQAAMKDIRNAERDREKMRMELERGQYAEKLGQFDKAQGHYEKAQELKLRANDQVMSAATQMAVSKQQIEGQKEVANIRGGYDIRQAQIAAAAHDPLALYRVLGGGDVSKGYAVAKQDPLRATLTENWAKQAYPVSGMPNEGFIKRYPTPETYIQEALTLQGGAAGSAGAGEAPVIRSR